MNRRRALVALAGAALATGAATAGPAHAGPVDADAADVVTSRPFAADSGDPCPMGVTKGRLGWHPGAFAVDVKGVVIDRPLSSPVPTLCRDDGRFTTATFTAHSRGRVVVTTQRIDNGQRTFSFSLSTLQPVEKVVVRVCRQALPPGPAVRCGKPQEYPAPVTTQEKQP